MKSFNRDFVKWTLVIGALLLQVLQETALAKGEIGTAKSDPRKWSVGDQSVEAVRRAFAKLQADLDQYIQAKNDGNHEQKSRLIGEINRDLAALNKLNVATRIKPFHARSDQEMDRALEPFISSKPTAFFGKRFFAGGIAAMALAVQINMAWDQPDNFGGDVFPGTGFTVRNDRRRDPR